MVDQCGVKVKVMWRIWEKIKIKKYEYESENECDQTWDRDQWGGLLGRDRAKGSQGAPVMFKLFLFCNIAIM